MYSFNFNIFFYWIFYIFNFYKKKNGIGFCRNKCFDEKFEDFVNKEKECYKNCFSKYSNSIDIYNKEKDGLFNYFGFEIFSLNKNDSKNLDKIYNFLHEQNKE